MKFKFFYIWILLLTIIITSCENNPNNPNDPNPYNYTHGTFPEDPVNMSDFNTEYNDYNSTSPTLGSISPLCFSTNRNSFGNDYNIVYKLLNIEFSKKTGVLLVNDSCPENYDVFICNENLNNAMEVINTDFNEFGPNMKYLGYDWPNYQYLLLYSNNVSGNQDIKFINNFNSEEYIEPINISFLNTEFDDLYPTFNDELNPNRIYFTSNRNGNFDIFYVLIDPNNDINQELMNNDTKEVFKESTLSSNYEDKCPMIIYNLMVFSSDRPEGFGGFDLYYSYNINGDWSEPQNFGSGINTEYDEYRPFVKYMSDFTNDFMIFSSNRPNGIGGFDLYYVGIDKIE